MTTRIVIILIVLLAVCPDGFCQHLKGKKDGIHREYYESGQLKFEYMVKNEKLNGFYEKYDEVGDLEYRGYYIDGVFDGVDRNHYFFPLFFWYQHIGEDAQEIRLNDEEAIEEFAEDYELVSVPKPGNWMGIPRTRIPVGKYTKGRHPVTLVGISKNYIYLKEYEDKNDIKPSRHYFYKLIRKYKIQRSQDVDSLFNVDLIEEVFLRRHTGVEFGTPFGARRRRERSRLRTVQEYLGEPDYIFPLEPTGWFDVYYEDQDLNILGHSSAVYFMETGRPQWADSSKYRNKQNNINRRIKQLQLIEDKQ